MGAWQARSSREIFSVLPPYPRASSDTEEPLGHPPESLWSLTKPHAVPPDGGREPKASQARLMAQTLNGSPMSPNGFNPRLQTPDSRVRFEILDNKAEIGKMERQDRQEKQAVRRKVGLEESSLCQPPSICSSTLPVSTHREDHPNCAKHNMYRLLRRGFISR